MATGLVVALCVLFGVSGPTVAQGPNRAGLVIRYGEDAVETFCVQFEEAEIDGLELLRRSGVPLIYSAGGFGTIICRIGQTGCANPDDCFCQCRGATCTYWSYWHLVDGVWQYSNLGASSFKVKPGTVDGWVWGAGTVNAAPSPPPITFEQICRPAPTATPTATSTATPTPTDVPTATPTATPTAIPTATPTAMPAAPSPTPESAAPTFTPTATSSATPTATPTVTPSATQASATQASATPVPTATSMPSPSATPSSGKASSPYWSFAGLLGLLLVVGWMVLRRKRG